MTPKQERFCREYIIDYNGKQAAIRAGFSEKTAKSQATHMLRKAEILACVRAMQHEQAERLAVSADFVILRLVETLERCMTAQPVMVWDPSTRQKVESGAYTFDSKGALRALELIGKHLGMFEDRMRLSAGPDTGKLDSILTQLREPDGMGGANGGAAPGRTGKPDADGPCGMGGEPDADRPHGTGGTGRSDSGAAGSRVGGKDAGNNG